MTPNQILKVLSSMRKNGVRYLLMGGQACVFYGAAEFSRDTDIVVVPDAANLQRLQAALDELQAECIAVPPFEPRHLDAGLSIHFRCQHPDAAGIRVDIMSKLRGVAEFTQLWQRRTTLEFGEETIELLSLPDLVQAKKTQRDKDWPMLARLVEAHYHQHHDQPSPPQIDFWLRELRTPNLLLDAARCFPDRCERIAVSRPLLSTAMAGDLPALTLELRAEEDAERAADREYWRPLKAALEQLRRERRP